MDEARVLKFAEKLSKKPNHQLMTQIAGGSAFEFATGLAAVQTKEDIDSLNGDAWELMVAWLEARDQKKIEERSARTTARLQNRVLYRPTARLIHRRSLAGQEYWRYELGLESMGLLGHIMAKQYQKEMPMSIQLIDERPIKERSEAPINPVWWGKFRSENYVISQQRLAWSRDVLPMVLKAFPHDVEFAAYNHRLRSPLLPGGYLHTKVGFWPQTVDIRSHTTFQNGKFIKDIETMSQGADGSGCYDPAHPDMADLVSRYGPVVFQLTVMTEDGLFAKGLMVPREGIGTPECGIWLDHKQVKGARKKLHATYAEANESVVYSNAHVGVMQCWHRKAMMAANYEQIEHIKLNEQTKAIFKELITESIQNLTKKGVDQMLARIARDDEGLRIQIQITNAMRAKGQNVTALSNPLVASALWAKLGRRLWNIAVGGGVYGQQLVLIMDNSVPVGECFTNEFKVGAKLAFWRFPTVLGGALKVLKNREPASHQMVNFQGIRYCVFMNPLDVLPMQGDDDGDIVACTPDPRVVKLWEAAHNKNSFAIEPTGIKREVPADSEEGWKYSLFDPTGPVGMTTMWHTKLLAVGDYHGAMAMAVLNQEVLDSAKRVVEWTNWELACSPENWERQENGVWKLKAIKGMKRGTGEFPKKDIASWVRGRLNMFGCINNYEMKQNPIGWYYKYTPNSDGEMQRVKKTLDPNHWFPSHSEQNGFMGGNAVHYTHDLALETWKSVEAQFERGEAVDQRMLLANMFGTKISIKSWEDYMALRQKSGLVTHGEKLKVAMGIENDERRHQEIKLLEAGLALELQSLNLQELGEIWYWEHTNTWKLTVKGRAPQFFDHKVENAYQCNKPGNAYRVVSAPGSPLLKILGLEDATCSFMTDKSTKVVNGRQVSRIESLVTYCLSKESPIETLTDIMYKDQEHEKLVKTEDGGGVPLHSCPECMEMAQSAVIRELRKSKTSATIAALKNFISDKMTSTIEL